MSLARSKTGHSLAELLRAHGLERIVCSHCGKSLEAAPLVRSVFAGILCRVREGVDFRLQAFGSFRLRRCKKGYGATKGLYSHRKTIAFRPSKAAKAFINEAEP